MNQAAHKEEAGWKWESRNEREIKEMKNFFFVHEILISFFVMRANIGHKIAEQ